MQISKNLAKNTAAIREAFRDCGDIIMREFRIHGGEGTLFMIYTDNIVDGDAIQDFIMTNVMARCEMQGTEGLLQSLMDEVISIGMVIAAVSGYFAIGLVNLLADKGKFGKFAFYCWGIGAAAVVATLIFH